MYSRQQLTADLRSLGIASGDIIMAHASVILPAVLRRPLPYQPVAPPTDIAEGGELPAPPWLLAYGGAFLAAYVALDLVSLTQDEADRRYNEALTHLDAVVQKPRESPHPPIRHPAIAGARAPVAHGVPAQPA